MSTLSAKEYKCFEDIKRIRPDGSEYWAARELAPVLDYAKWENFYKVIKRAMIACENSGRSTLECFPEVRKTSPMPNGGVKDILDYELSRYACYLIVQNGDPRKEVIALGQTYFAIQTYRQEVADRFNQLDEDINKFATDVTDDNVVNSYKELIDWVAKHGPEATEMAGGISENKTAIADLKTLVGTLPEGATSTTVVAYITEAINALSIGDYAKTTEVTAAISTALESYYTKTQVDETFVKKTDIVMATDEEVDAMLTEVFGAQATV